MKINAFPATILLFIAAVNGDSNMNQIKPFPEQNPTTISEKAAIKFKPSLKIDSGCHPYPVVDAQGTVSEGLNLTVGGVGAYDQCAGSPLGSQVYSRSTWHQDLWAIMYAWYFPTDRAADHTTQLPVTSQWVNAVVWLDNPAVADQTIVKFSTFHPPNNRYNTYNRLSSDHINGTHPKIHYFIVSSRDRNVHSVDVTSDGGDFQDLIDWTQMTAEARNALEKAVWRDGLEVPFIDATFTKFLQSAWEARS